MKNWQIFINKILQDRKDMIPCCDEGESGLIGRPFIFVVDTEGEGQSDNNQFLISVEGYNGRRNLSLGSNAYSIKTSDGQEINGVTGNYLLTFPSAGIYTIEIYAPKFAFVLGQDSQRITEVIQWGTPKFQFMIVDDDWGNPNNIDMISTLDTPDLSECITLYRFFQGYQYTTVNNIGNWDVGNVQNMAAMFTSSQFNQNIGGWNVSNVQNMVDMFSDSIFNQDISGWNVSNVQYMGGMFYGSPFNQDISSWNVENVQDMASMFQSNAAFNQNISGWNVSNVQYMGGMFSDSIFNQDISGWNVENVQDMASMFQSNAAFNQDLSTWCVSNVIYHTVFDDGATAWVLPKPNFANPPC